MAIYFTRSVCSRLLFASISFLFAIVQTSAQEWSVIQPSLVPVKGQRDIIPDRFVTYAVEPLELQTILLTAPDELTTSIYESGTILSVGLADGRTEEFRIVEYTMMEPGLRKKYPGMKTYRGVAVNNKFKTIRIDWTNNGFRAVIREPGRKTYIDPFQRNDLRHCIAYYRNDIQPSGYWSCDVEGDSTEDAVPEKRVVGDCMFRSYRLAQAANGEYCNYFGATSSAQSAIIMSEVITAINRVNEVYEIDISVRLILVDNVDTLFFYNPSTDPYTNGNGSTMLGQNITTCDNRIGNANYDIGHVFSTGGGGVAYLNAVCNNSIKAGGVTGQPNPVNDPFYIDYVAHEMGHQFGGNHTQNNACNRNAATAMEPGSASTIMGYAGICSPNVQSNSDAYFHGVNLQEIANRVTSTSCHAVISMANNAPVVANLLNYTIPISTPFVLTASATDPDNNPMTYCWEQWDQEVGTMPPASTNTVGPMFRSLDPTTSPSRYFYNLPDLVNNVNPTWEELPSVSRSMEFKVVVRDYNGLYGCTDEDNTIITTTTSSGPFVVTSQNSGATWLEGSNQTITWNVANTTASPVSCSHVEIRLSYDGGLTYPTIAAANEVNDGSAIITVPAGTTTQGRIMVKAVNNIFFDINNQNITIEEGLPNYTLALNPVSVSECNDGSVQTTVIVGSFMGYSDPVTLSLINPPPGAIAVFLPAIVIPGNTSTLTISNLTGLSGSFTPVVRGNSTTGIKELNFPVSLTNPASVPVLTSPVNHAVDVDLRQTLAWATATNAASYEYQISLSNTFNTVLFSGSVTTTQILINTLLENETKYYWRVRSNNICGSSAWSTVYDFKTMACQSYMSIDVPITIPSGGGSPTITSILSVPLDAPVLDVNVIGLTGTHTFVDNLKFTLVAPDNTQVLFWDRPCNNEDNFNINFDDESADMNWPCPPTNGLSYKPNNSFLPFDGVNALGTWTLKIQDVANMNGGALTGWGLRVCRAGCDLMVTEASGSGPGTIADALLCAGPGDTIILSSVLSNQLIDVGPDPLVLTKEITILSQSPDISITGSGTRPFEISPDVTVELTGMNIIAGTALEGGAIRSRGMLTLKNVSIDKNPAVTGATLIYNLSGTLKMAGTCVLNQ